MPQTGTSQTAQQSLLGFNSGMNTDADKSLRSSSTYLRAENFTLTSNDGGTAGALENAKGNELDPSIQFAVGHEMVGYASVVDDTVYFTTDGVDSNIYYHKDGVLTLKYSDSASTYKLSFSLLPEHRIVAIGRQELTTLEKVYWVDGLNEYRYIDLDKDYIGKEATIFNSIPPNDLNATIRTEVLPTAGEYTSGVVYHSYQLYSVNGATSTISPASFGVNLSKYTGLKDGGNEKGEDSGCAVRVSIDNLSADVLDIYNRIRVYAVLYTSEGAPLINVVTERSLTDDSITIVDTGTYIDTIEVGQYTTYNQVTYVPDAITSKENTVLIGNLKESAFTSSIIDAWDARAYRFIGPGEAFTYSEITDSATPTEYLQVSNTTFKVSASTVPGVNIGDDVPEDFDCANDYNNIFTKDLVSRRAGTNPRTGFYKYQADNATLGGEGINVKYGFVDRGKYLDEDFNTTIRTDRPVNNIEGDTYTDISETQEIDMKECEDGEVYRIGIKFYNSKGQSSFVKWVGDVLWEERFDSSNWGLGLTNSITGGDASPHFTGYKYSNYGKNASGDEYITSRAKVLAVTIIPPADPEIVSWQVVRAERTNIDATVVGNGMLNQTLTDGAIERPTTTTYLDSYDDTKSLFKFSSPEFQFNNPSDVDFTGLKVRVYNKYARIFDDSVAITATGRAYAAKTRELKALSATGSSTFINLIDIVDSKWVEPHYAQDGLSYPDYSIGPYSFRNSNRKLGDDYGAGHSGYVFNLDFTPDIVAGNDDVVDSVLYASVLKDTDKSRYGGISHQDILNTVYIPFSDITPIGTTTQLAGRGDVVSTMYYYMQCLYYDSGDYAEEAFQFLNSFPVQSKLDTRRRLDRMLDYYTGLDVLDTHPTPSSLMFLAETVEKGISLQGSVYDQEIGDLYRYNPVYSSEPAFETSFTKPFDFIEEPHSTTKVLASEKKINGESEDQWTNFLANNFIEVDSAYGPINSMFTKDNKVFFWQDKAFGTLAVNDRSLITDASGAQLSLGTGAVLERYDYLSNTIGNVDKYNIDHSENSLFWTYSPKNLVCAFDNQVKELSTSGGVSKYMRNKGSIINPITVTDDISKEVLFKLNDEVFIFDYLTGTFTGIYTYNPKWFVKMFNGNFKSSENGYELFTHNNGNRATYYGVTYPSTIKHLCTEGYPMTKVFDTMRWDSTSTSPSGVILYDDTFSTMRLYNDYQTTQNDDASYNPLNFTPDGTIRRKERSFTTVIPRDRVDRVNNGPKDNVDIFNVANLDNSQLHKARMRDKYIVLDMEYDNTPNNTFSVPYIIINNRISTR